MTAYRRGRASRTIPDAEQVVKALCRLGRVRSLDRLGQRGPLQAASGKGSPFSEALFGRDTAFMALDLLEDFPLVARRTIEALTIYQGVQWRKRSEEEPGRILHEQRFTAKGRNPHWDYPYYGSIDATPLYVRLVSRYVERYGPGILGIVVNGKAEQPVSVAQGVERAVGWVCERLERFPFLWVQRAQPHGLANQVWPDSRDAFWYEDGRLFDPDLPNAPVTVQGLAYDALVQGAQLTADPDLANRWRQRAEQLRRDLIRQFLPFAPREFLLALVYDGGEHAPPTPSRVVASDPGHLLDSAVLEGEGMSSCRKAIAERLFQPDMLAPAGIRIKSVGGARFNPGSYHNGSVWPMDTGRIADGLRRFGFVDMADELDARILRGCAQVGFLAEFFRGDTGEQIRVNKQRIVVDGHTVEQPPQHTQGWTVTRVWKIMRRQGLIAYGPPAWTG